MDCFFILCSLSSFLCSFSLLSTVYFFSLAYILQQSYSGNIFQVNDYNEHKIKSKNMIECFLYPLYD